MSGWPFQRSDSGGCGMRMPSLGFVRKARCAVCSVIRRRASSPLSGAQKNALRRLRTSAPGLVRPAHAPRARSVLRRCAHLPRIRGAARPVQELRRSEARAAGLPRRQPVLHQALCPLRGAALPLGDDQGHRPGVEPRLGHGQGRWRSSTCAAQLARAGTPGPEGDRHRRDLDPQGPHLPHRGERPDSRRGRSGSAARTARRRAWASSTTGSERRRAAAFAWR